MTGKDIEKWADEAMFSSEKHNAAVGPIAHLLGGPNDPLGQIAACAKMYLGEVVRDLSDVTDQERRHYAEEMKKTKLKMPLEAVSFHFMLENVTRAFTHQLVRQRTAAYAQESMRFAVVEDMTEAVALPPSLAAYNDPDVVSALRAAEKAVGFDRLHPTDKAFLKWEETVGAISRGYSELVNSGMPAEEARGLMPTNIITRVNYITNLRGLLDHAGNRLCTQAQFEWRVVFSQIVNALRAYGKTARYRVKSSNPTSAVTSEPDMLTDDPAVLSRSASWQYDVIASILQPVCYQTGSCAFKADFDRKCSIRERVDANASIGRESSNWDMEYDTVPVDEIVSGVGPKSVILDFDGRTPVFIGAIHPAEWLTDHESAR